MVYRINKIEFLFLNVFLYFLIFIEYIRFPTGAEKMVGTLNEIFHIVANNI